MLQSSYSSISAHPSSHQHDSPWQPSLHLLPTPNLNFENVQQARQQLRDYFLNTFDTYEQLFDCLRNDEAFYIKPIPLRHPLIFYFGHTATFFINKLLLTPLIHERINPHFESMFAIGVDEMSWDDLSDVHYDWPSVEAVRDYRHQVRALVIRLIEQAQLTLPIQWDHPWWAIIMGIEHERIHLETSSVLIRQHELKYVQQHPLWQAKVESSVAPINQLITVPSGDMTLNKTWNDGFYGWDNEYGHHSAHVHEFQASQYLVSNAEFLDFVEDGGYETASYWSTEGLDWLNFSEARFPTFWIKQANGWKLRLMLEEIAIPWDWPVEVNYHEAKAFCQWKSQHTHQQIRLPTEDEWYRLYAVSDLDASNPCPSHANLALQYAPHSSPVNRFKQGDFFDVHGNVWQWTETPTYPFNCFKVHPIYDDFTTPTFDGQHHLIKGGSWISAGNEALHSARFAFRRHFFQHAGFRYVCSETSAAPLRQSSSYETDQMVSQYLEFQYGANYFDVRNFAQSLVELAKPYFKTTKQQHALDLGCATGRASFELARYFPQVTGLDFSARFIQQATMLAQGETVRYSIPIEGDLVEYKECSLDPLGLKDKASRVQFLQADACNLKPQFCDYDFILAANLIDRLHHPTAFLTTIHRRLNLGGILMLSSPYTWLEEYTARNEWIGGFEQDGESITTLQGITQILQSNFELLKAPQDVAFVIRETARKYQHTLSQVTLWRRIK